MRIEVNNNIGDYLIIDLLAAVKAIGLHKINPKKMGYEFSRGNRFITFIVSDTELFNRINSYHFSEFLCIDSDMVTKARRNVPKDYVIIYNDSEEWLVNIMKEIWKKAGNNKPFSEPFINVNNLL